MVRSYLFLYVGHDFNHSRLQNNHFLLLSLDAVHLSHCRLSVLATVWTRQLFTACSVIHYYCP